MPLPGPPPTDGVLLRRARPDDLVAVARLAALDSTTPPEEPVLLAEEDGVLRAALSLTTGRAVADPFAPTAHLVALLRRHAARRAAPPGASRGTRLPRLAFRAG